MTLTSTRRSRSIAAVTVGWLSLLGAAGCALLAIGHMGVQLPLLSAIGPGGDRAVPQAAVAFAIATLLYGVVAGGAFRRTPWAWPAALTVHGLVIIAGLGQFRGAASAIGIVLALVAVAVLLSPAGRRGLRHG